MAGDVRSSLARGHSIHDDRREAARVFFSNFNDGDHPANLLLVLDKEYVSLVFTFILSSWNVNSCPSWTLVALAALCESLSQLRGPTITVH